MCRILVVDEQPVVRELVAEVFSQRGHEAMCVNTEAEALALLDQNEVDLVLIDLPLSCADAQDLLVQMRRDERLRHTPVLVLDDEDGDEPAGKVASGMTRAVTRVDRARFQLDELFMQVDACLGIGRKGADEHRSAYRVRSSGHDISVHINGMGPWQVLDVSSEGLGVVAETRLDVGEKVSVLLRDVRARCEGRMRVANYARRPGGRHRYGLGVVEQCGPLGRGLATISMRLQREYLRIRSERR